MFKQYGKPTVKLLALAAACACLPYVLAGQRPEAENPQRPAASRPAAPGIEHRLAQKADFIPADKPALEQLIEVAQHYRLPMGIEWVKDTGARELDVTLPSVESGPTVRDILQVAASRLPGYQVTVTGGVVHVAQPASAVAADNFLNVRIEEFSIKDENLFDAEEQLRLSIDMTLNPEEYEDGYLGSYGYGTGDVLAKRNVTFRGRDLTVREILDGLIKASGNALWIAEPARRGSGSEAAAAASREGVRESPKLKYRWRFVPLVE